MEDKPPQSVIDRLDKLKADGILDDPGVVEIIKEAFTEISELRQDQGQTPDVADLRRMAQTLSKELGRPISLIDVAAALEHYGSQPKSNPKQDQGVK